MKIQQSRLLSTGIILLLALLRFPQSSSATTDSIHVAKQTSATASASQSTSPTLRELNTGTGSVIYVLKLEDNIINPVTSHFIIDSITRCENENVPLVIQLDTPGGLLQSTREAVKRILGSRIPVITYVYPSGSRAASAGMFITYASHVAAMAPSTNIGAAHVVNANGKWPGRRRLSDLNTSGTAATSGTRSFGPFDFGGPEEESSADDVMNEKIMNDTLAWIEGIARLRGRNIEWARDAVNHSVSVTADVAVSQNVVDLLANNVSDLLEKLDGKRVKVEGGQYTMHTAKAVVNYLELTTRQRILDTLANPNIAYALLLFGFLLVAYEMTHPGVLLPGITGGICLLLAALALQMLPTNYAAILLIIAGVAMIIAEIKFTSYGVLTAGGTVCLFFGSLALFDRAGPFIGVSLAVIIPVVTCVVSLLVLLVFLVIRSQARRPALGRSSYIGQIAEVARALDPNGKVFFNGTYWDAVSATPIPRGTKVRIVSTEGFKLLVEPLE